MRILITNRQLNLLKENAQDYIPCTRDGSNQIHPEDIIFFKKFYDRFKFLPYPKEMERLGNQLKVGDIYPEHPMSHLTMKSFYICKSKVFSQIKREVANELGLFFSKGGSRNYITMDDKHYLRSMFEVIFYNVFYLNGQSDRLEVDSRKFYNECGEINKEVDFIYDDKIVIEVAGMEKPNYYEKIESAMKCIKSLGYQTKVYKVRNLEKKKLYTTFYQQICKDFGFPIEENILKSPDKLIGHKNLNMDMIKKFIDDNIGTASQTGDRNTYEKLNKFVRQLYGKSVREYRKELGIKQKNR
jgi:hypothetical protein